VTKEKASIQSNLLLRLLCSIPFWWLGMKGYQAAMLPSKNPDLFGLYSYKKIIALIGITTVCVFGTKLIYPKLCSLTENLSNKLKLSLVSPYIAFLFIYFIVSIFIVSKGLVVGEDISAQVNSSYNYVTEKINAPNILLVPSNEDLSINMSRWHIRPPGASWLALPGLLLGLSVGQSVKISLIFTGMLGGIGWLKLASKLGIKQQGLLYISILLSFSIGISTYRFGTMNTTLAVVVPWMILTAISISERKLNNKMAYFISLILITIFYLILGCFCILKMSGMIVAITIGSIPIFLNLWKTKIPKRKHLLIIFIILSPLIFIPVKTLSSFNESNLGYNSHEVYKTSDYNKQSLLWGEHFVQSTRGKLLILSTIGSPGYALPPKVLMHNARDFFNQFESYLNWSSSYEINSHVFICGILGSIIIIPIFLIIKNNINYFTNLSITITFIFYILPFLGLATLTHLHGFNYSLYPTHTFEYSLLLLFPIIFLWETLNFKKKISRLFIMSLLALPLLNTIHSIPPIADDKYISSTESKRGLSSSRFSKSIDYIEHNSTNDLDIIYFLPEGDMGDLVLRTNMRNMATHFASDNLRKIKPLKSSKELNVYIAYDKTLDTNPIFQKEIINKFPDSKFKNKILKDSIFVQKISLLPSLKVFE